MKHERLNNERLDEVLKNRLNKRWKKVVVAGLASGAVLCVAFGLAACNEDNDEFNPDEDFAVEKVAGTEGLEYQLSENGKYYLCTGIGSATATDITIASWYNEKWVRKVDNMAFSENTTIERVTIPDSIAYLGKFAFNNCTNLKSATLPDSITTIGLETFAGCSSLTDITIPNTITEIGEFAFYNCTSITELTIPDSVDKMTRDSFFGCDNIVKVTVPAFALSYLPKTSLQTVVVTSGEEIPGSSLSGCDTLKSITIADSVTSIGPNAFSVSGLTEITIPTSVTAIDDYAFQYCNGLTEIAIPDSVTEIGKYVFADCKNLVTASIGNGITAIENGLFDDCDGLTSVTVGSGVTTIGDVAFNGCEKLTSVYYNGDVAGWCAIAFTDLTNPLYYAHNLYINNQLVTNLVIPDEVTSVGVGFRYCSGITSVTIGSGVTEIDDYAFQYCTALESVVLSDTLKEIGYKTFEKCSALTTVFYKGTAEDWKNVYIGAYNTCFTSNTNAATKYYYSETEPAESGNYWHFDADDVTPVVWNKQ